MHHPSTYLKMRVLGAIESALGKTQQERVENVAKMVFVDEEGNKRQFTWRTIYTWYYRYKHNGITSVQRRKRRDYKACRKISPEQLLEAINQVLPYFKKRKRYNKTDPDQANRVY
jgi:putative transposase